MLIVPLFLLNAEQQANIAEKFLNSRQVAWIPPNVINLCILGATLVYFQILQLK